MSLTRNLSDFANRILSGGSTPAQVRTGLGLLWKPLGLVKPTTAVATIDLTIPAEAKTLRLVGQHRVGSTTQILAARLSTDGGATFVSASTYYVGYVFQSGAGAPTGASASANSFFPMTVSSDATTVLSVPFEATFTMAEAGVSYSRFKSDSIGYTAGGGGDNWCSYRGYGGPALVRPTHIRFLCNSGNIQPGTEFAVEYL